MDASPTELREGRLLGGRYRLERRVASGGMATVWEAADEVLARQVAVKLLHPHLAADDTFVARFRREAVAAAKLSHPSIVSIYDTVSDDGHEAIVMELVRGHTLRDELDREGTLPPERAAMLVALAADALAAAHEAGIVHRDVKPANVLLSDDGRVLVADFGIAKAADGLDLTTTEMTLGTAKYVAPEQVEGGAVDARTDVYALGVILYELLCGRPPFVADTEAATALARLHRDPEPIKANCPAISDTLAAVVTRALARRPGDRYPSASAFAAAVRQGGSAPASAPPAPASPDATVAGPRTDDATRADDHTAAAPRRQALHAPAPTGAPPSPPKAARPNRRWGPVLAVALPIGIALIVVAALLATAGDGGGGGGDGGSGDAAIAMVNPTSFDPEGDGGERDDLAANLIDSDVATAWTTERYNERDLAGKSGVGVVVELAQEATIDRLVFHAATAGWVADIYVAAAPSPTLEGWGTPVGRIDPATEGTFEVDLGEATGRAVLVWITDPGPTPPFRVEINELTAYA